ncbi:uncharacterized protein LOC124896133 [Capsicum annuum]|uniref:uncharacterized protein LOC124896133 n=1 Tax=Capsicum annuum TaxID=4072 RepID=UPI001FB07916|nr:uncharacterized protein LOC124896133 [Capsicum annuum]
MNSEKVDIVHAQGKASRSYDSNMDEEVKYLDRELPKDLRVVSMINTVDDVAVTVPSEKRLGVETLAVIILNFNSDGINEYDEIEAVKKDIIKYRDIGVVYPIADIKYEEYNLVLSWEKCIFMVKEYIILCHKMSKQGIEVYRANKEAMEDVPPPVLVKGIRSFLGHAGFFKRFIKDISKIANPLCKLLEREVKFVFDDACLKDLCSLTHD